MPSNAYRDALRNESHVLQQMRNINALEVTPVGGTTQQLPNGIAYSGSKVYVLDYDTGASTHVAVLTNTYSLLSKIISSFSPGLLTSGGQAGGSLAASDSNLFIPDPSIGAYGGIKLYDFSGNYVSQWSFSNNKSPFQSAYNGHNIHTSSTGKLVVWDSANGSGSFITMYTSAGSEIVRSSVAGGSIPSVCTDGTNTWYIRGIGFSSNVLTLIKYDSSLSAIAGPVTVATLSNYNTAITYGRTSGNVIVGGDNKIYIINSSTLSTISSFTLTTSADLVLGVAEDDLGNIWVLCGTAVGLLGYVEVFSSSGTSKFKFTMYRSYSYPVAGQTTFYAYTSGTSKVSLGTPDAGVSVPSLTGMSSNNSVLSAQYILDLRSSVRSLVSSNHFKNPATGVVYNWTNGNANNLYYVAMGDRTKYGATGGAGYDWTRSGAAMVGTSPYDIDIGEIYECVAKLQAATVV